MRASRLLGILILLQLRGRMAGRDLAAEFEVTERTIYRDIDALSAAGVPVYGDRGPGGGFQLLDGYRTKLTGLAADEAEAMLMISLPSAASALGLGSAASRAKRKLLAALHPPSLEGAGRLGERIHLDPVEWYHAEQAAPFLPDLARAVLDSRQATIRYASWTSERDWAIDPLGLVMKAGAWYCVARSGNRTMTFKVANILTCTISETGFDRPTDFDLRAYWTSSLERFEEGCANARRRFARHRSGALVWPNSERSRSELLREKRASQSLSCQSRPTSTPRARSLASVMRSRSLARRA